MRPALFIYTFVYERSKLFFKMHLVIHLWSDSFHIWPISSLGGPTFGLCSAWRFGDFWRFGDLFNFQDKMVLHIVTQVIKCYVTVVASAKHKISVNHMRVRISVDTFLLIRSSQHRLKTFLHIQTRLCFVYEQGSPLDTWSEGIRKFSQHLSIWMSSLTHARLHFSVHCWGI